MAHSTQCPCIDGRPSICFHVSFHANPFSPLLLCFQVRRRQQVVSATPQQKTPEDAQVDIEKVVDDLKERVRHLPPFSNLPLHRSIVSSAGKTHRKGAETSAQSRCA